MDDQQEVAPKRRARRGANDGKIEALLGRIEHNEAEVAKTMAFLEIIEKLFDDLAIAPYQQDSAEAVEELAAILKLSRRSILRRFGQVSQWKNGSVKWQVARKSVELPADTRPIVNALLAMPGGKAFLITRYSVHKTALAFASRRRLKRLGLWAGRHEILSIKTPSMESWRELYRRRYPDRR